MFKHTYLLYLYRYTVTNNNQSQKHQQPTRTETPIRSYHQTFTDQSNTYTVHVILYIVIRTVVNDSLSILCRYTKNTVGK